MPIYRPKELMHYLQGSNLAPKKGLSQNFLIDGNIVRKIIEAARLEPQQCVLEIGPGPGVITEMLLVQGYTVVAVEKDKQFAESLHRLKSVGGDLHVCCDDILKVDISSLLADLSKQQKVVVIGNLPYALTTPIIEKLLPMSAVCSRLVLMVQDEFADRVIKSNSKKDLRPINYKIQLWAKEIKKECRVPSTCFYPVPRVDSAVISMDLSPTRKVPNVEKFLKVIEQAFQHKRKMLKSSLKDFWEGELIIESLKRIHCDEQSRPEDLSLDQWIDFFNRVQRV